MTLFKKKQPYKIIDGYSKLSDTYTESPFGHYKNAPDADKEEYFMQWIYPIKLQRLALRTAAGFRFIYLYAKDLWNNKLAIKIPKEKDKSIETTQKMINHLQTVNWFIEMEKLSAYEREQGEAILMLYSDDEGGVEKYKNELDPNKPILKVEAFTPLRYHIIGFDKYGKPSMYNVEVIVGGGWRDTKYVQVHPSRVLRKVANNLEYRYTGYSDLAAIADPIVVLSTILKACGEAAFRWGTGHPVFFTKDIVDDADLTKLKNALGDVTRRNWHAVPTEKIEKIEMLGQAGSMLNLKALADICIEQIVIGSGFPKPILLGEVAGVMGSEVSERSYFAKLDRDHTDLDPFVRRYFDRDVNTRKILNGIEYWEVDWGIREVFNKMDQMEFEQKRTSVAIAMQEYATINEVRKFMDLDPISEEEGGDWIKGLEAYYNMELQLTMAALQAQETKESEEATSMREKSNSTNKKAASLKEIEKNKRVAPTTRDSFADSLIIQKHKASLKDAIGNLRKNYSVNQLCREIGIYDKTLYKILQWSES